MTDADREVQLFTHGSELPVSTFPVGITSAEITASLRSSTDASWRHSNGIYFTGDELAEVLWQPALTEVTGSSVIIDPACGAGNLLMPALRHLQALNLSTPPELQLHGMDIQTDFVRLTRQRIFGDLKDGRSLMGQVFVADFLQMGPALRRATHVVMNPPFNNVLSDETDTWTSGSVNAAAVFVLHALRHMSDSALLMAILPDVLRSGSRYARWRGEVTKYATIESIHLADQFDEHTDVHVFLVHLRRRAKQPQRSSISSWLMLDQASVVASSTVDAVFEVSVGSVVPHRHEDSGDPQPYLDARQIRGCASVSDIVVRRGFSGRLHQGPFIVVRRTSRPEQSPRLNATLVNTNQRVAVENHLIVLEPKEGGLATCEQYVAKLGHPDVDNYLNGAIRMRHLTVGAVKSAPLTIERG